MNNVIKFQRPKPQKPPRQVPPGLRKALVAAAILIGLVLVWAYFQFIAPSSGLPT
ncbi:hypothetical protein SAMN05880590_10729 [Rhizobium sp. RU35A]|uniref:hypothetical protein n=1 Tax=Rhizobium TaxID=379 RepID=UPI000955A9CB|nr:MULTISPECIES: hypothetical protein [Rhizobium]SIQ75720.1 hypothetical protein SAMN05880590_10729 [Rhizobium sp. RU35A]